MKQTVFKKTLGVSCMALAAGFLLVCGQIVLADNNAGTDLTQEITGGIRELAFHDDADEVVPSPSVEFDSTVTSVNDQETNGTLGVATQKIYLANGTETPEWTMNMNVADPGLSMWTDGSNQYDYMNKLTVNPTTGTIEAALTGCDTSEGLNLASGGTFESADALTLATAGGAADVLCAWYFTGIDLEQTIPGQTPTGNYELPMVLSVN